MRFRLIIAPVVAVVVAGLLATVLFGSGCAQALSIPAFFVDRQTAANNAKSQYPSDAARLETIAGTPQVTWFSSPQLGPATNSRLVGDYVNRARRVNNLPLIALYGAPDRDCNGYSAGGARSLGEYYGWIDAVASAIGSRQAGILIEPDGLSSVTCLNPLQSATRVAAIKYAVDKLSANSNALIYVDIGHSRWLAVPDAARLLQSVGVGKVRGFSLNVSNFFTTAEEQAYGESLSAALGGGARYVIDTSRNGNGPAPASDPLNWCNPAGRALGHRPTTSTTAAHADAYLWVKHPGESDGPCNRGEPTSGHWFHSYAMNLIRNSR